MRQAQSMSGDGWPAGLEVTLLQGDRIIADIVPGGVRDDELADFELATAGVSAFRDIAGRLHAVSHAAR